MWRYTPQIEGSAYNWTPRAPLRSKVNAQQTESHLKYFLKSLPQLLKDTGLIEELGVWKWDMQRRHDWTKTSNGKHSVSRQNKTLRLARVWDIVSSQPSKRAESTT